MKNVNSTKLRSFCTLGQQILFHGLVKIVFVLVLLVQLPLNGGACIAGGDAWQRGCVYTTDTDFVSD